MLLRESARLHGRTRTGGRRDAGGASPGSRRPEPLTSAGEAPIAWGRAITRWAAREPERGSGGDGAVASTATSSGASYPMITAVVAADWIPTPLGLIGATRNTTLAPVGRLVTICVVAVELNVRTGYVHPLMIGVTA